MNPSRLAALAIVAALACDAEPTLPETSSGTLALSAVTAAFDAMVAGANPGVATVAISNSAAGTLSGLKAAVAYAPGQATGWLTASLSATTAPSTLTLSAATGSLAAGTHGAVVAISADGATNGPQTVGVTFIVFAAGIYVSTGDPLAVDNATCGLGPAGTGAGRFPCRTIAQGLSRAVAIARTAVLVADGFYDEPVTLVNGISLLGGHRPDTWERHVSTTNTVIQGASTMVTRHQAAIIANGVTSTTVFEGFVVRGPSNGLRGNSYAIYVSGSDADLAIRRNVIYGGRGGSASAGSEGSNGAPGNPGGDRSDSPAAYDAFITGGTGFCNVSNNRQLTNGGSATFGGDLVDGGPGGGNFCPTASNLTKLSGRDGLAGQPGAPSRGGAGGGAGAGGWDGRLETGGSQCFVPASSMNGANGSAGTDGAPGPAVAGGSSGSGTVSSSHWLGTSGQLGISGGNGGGGGGGGAGGGAYCTSCAENKDRLGGHGGGAGSGGAGGQGGGVGDAGGGAFGVFVVGSAAPTVSDNVFVRGEGGAGSPGGSAGAGGFGGAGGDGGLAIFCTGTGGKGGDGGDGGHGSGGGGGSGGASYAIYTAGTGPQNYCDAGSNNVITGGAGGAGGSGGLSFVNPGGAGVSGVVGTCSYN